ncbi:hypothetical protein [Pseudomonas sp. LB3P31]
MQDLKNFVAVDWRSGKDAVHFFFKTPNTYSRFDIADNEVPQGYPSKISEGNWGSFHTHARNLRFGFTTTSLFNDRSKLDADSTWLFYLHEGQTPFVCKYNQDSDKVAYMTPVSKSVWRSILPYFNSIVAGTWWKAGGSSTHFRFLMDNGSYLTLDFDYSVSFDAHASPVYKYENDFHFKTTPIVKSQKIDSSTWPGLEQFKNRIITAVQNDRTFGANYYYIFLTNNEYIRFNMSTNRAESGPIKVDEHSWPGLLRD